MTALSPKRSNKITLFSLLGKIMHSQNNIAIALVFLGLLFSTLVMFMPERLDDRWLNVCNNVITAGVALFSVHMTPESRENPKNDP
jgi:hypothetical protein